MEIREANETDIPAIVDLLKLSLGESLMPKSKEYWIWKHVDNPFGSSPVLLCWEGASLIGVRAFMRWEWIGQEQIYKAVRAVDTASHPAHQGKGIFKKLTLSLVDYCKQQGDHFVFNTPNRQSKPGYLKMGWEEAGKLPVAVTLQRPLNIIPNLMGYKDVFPKESSSIDYYLDHADLESLIRTNQVSSNTITTHVSAAYLRWRYSKVPVAQYVAVGEEKNAELTGLVIGRLKQTKFGREFRITDCFFKEHKNYRELTCKLAEKKRKWGVDYTTMSGVTSHAGKITGRLSLRAAIGPVVTIRSLSLADLYMLKKFRYWSPSVGDLELF